MYTKNKLLHSNIQNAFDIFKVLGQQVKISSYVFIYNIYINRLVLMTRRLTPFTTYNSN